jgi:hypothetical protein
MRSRVSWPLATRLEQHHRYPPTLQLLYMSSRSFLDILKPRYHEAVYRLKNSIIALIALFTLTHLLPLPTPYASAWNFYRDSFQSSWEKSIAFAGVITLYKLALPPLLTQDHDGARMQNYPSSVSSLLTFSKQPSRSVPPQHPTLLSHRHPNPSRPARKEASSNNTEPR